jgi:hypothetical protein
MSPGSSSFVPSHSILGGCYSAIPSITSEALSITLLGVWLGVTQPT